MSIIKPFMVVAAALLTLALVSDPGYGAGVFTIVAALAVGFVAGIIAED